MRTLSRIATLSVLLAGALAAAQAPSALAIGAPIHVTDNVNLRGAPNAGSARVGGIYRGASPDFNCWAQGQNIGGVDVWFNVNYGGATGFYASYYDDSHYASDAQITAKYGIPQCGSAPAPASQPAPPPASRALAAMGWARSFADRGSSAYYEMCLKFVFDAYAAAGVNLRGQVAYPIGGNTYPQDIWGRFTQGQTGGGTPPAGALVFFRSRTGNRLWSHVALSIGGGTLVSTADGVASRVHYETIAQHSYAIYQGWWLPNS